MRHRFVVSHGAWRWFLAYRAITMPWRSIYVLCAHGHDSQPRRHGLVHIAQIERLGPLRFGSLYLFYLARCGYRDNPLEQEAFGDPERGAGRCVGE
jgi:hypothetical protein